jgi:GxxExxY protein
MAMLHEDITYRIIGAAMNVHSALGAGLLESTYNACLCHEFLSRRLQFEHQVRLPVVYNGITIDAGYRIDFLVEGCVIVELKSVEKLIALHKAQLITYLKLSGRHVGLLINFNVPHLRQGIQHIVNGYEVAIGNQLPAEPSVSSVSSVVESSKEETGGNQEGEAT